jgi:hypothetical protein
MADHDPTPAAVGDAEARPDGPVEDPAWVAGDESRRVDRGEEWIGRWNEIQITFVDEPRRSIENADALVDEVMRDVTARLAEQRARLESQWNASHAGSEPSTEELRVALQRYRSFFNRLVSA